MFFKHGPGLFACCWPYFLLLLPFAGNDHQPCLVTPQGVSKLTWIADKHALEFYYKEARKYCRDADVYVTDFQVRRRIEAAGEGAGTATGQQPKLELRVDAGTMARGP